MIPNEVLSEELLQHATAELSMAFNNSLPSPNECLHKFSVAFKEKMKSLIKGIGITCYTLAIQDSANRQPIFCPIAGSIVPTYVECWLIMFL